MALMISIETIDQAQQICKVYVSLNRDLDPSHFPGWIYTSVLTDFFHSGGVTLASTLPPCATSTRAVAASKTDSSDSSESTVTTTASGSIATTTTSGSVVTTTASSSVAAQAASKFQRLF